MIVKAFEVRDRHTFIPVLAVQMEASGLSTNNLDAYYSRAVKVAQLYLLRRCGYPSEPPYSVLLTKLAGEGRSTADPYDWGDRTFQVAHHYILEHFDELADGDVIDVEYVLGETTEKKISERVTSPL